MVGLPERFLRSVGEWAPAVTTILLTAVFIVASRYVLNQNYAGGVKSAVY